mmetsp:Transcript_1957/g.3709  ORF Transcript_1957/g.3709 Transcript_1957/m.3709 type:complete len:88 (+) Transcript_1957:170-433(+)|eukprot:6197475-Pleurochrysis_carterae.AAC.2
MNAQKVCLNGVSRKSTFRKAALLSCETGLPSSLKAFRDGFTRLQVTAQRACLIQHVVLAPTLSCSAATARSETAPPCKLVPPPPAAT